MAGAAVKPKFTVEDAPASPKFSIEDAQPDISSESYMAAHPPAAPKPTMRPSYSALALANSPGGADPHNPGNPNLNAVPQSERGAVNDRALTTQVASLGAEPLAEAAITGSAKPLIPLAKGIVGSTAGKFIGHEAGGLIGHPEAGGTVGGLAGGLYGLSGGKIPLSRLSLEQMLETPETQPQLGAPLPSYEDYAANRGTEISRAIKQQPEAFKIGGPEAQPQLGAPLPSAEQFYQNRGTDIMRAMRQQPEAFEAPTTGTAPTVTKPSTNTGVAVLPEPRAPFEGETPNYMASVPRPKLERLALSGKPGAGTQLQQLGQRVIYAPRGEGIESPSMDALRQSLGIGSPEPMPTNRITLNPVGGGGARPLTEDQFESSFGPEHKEVGDLAEWETGNREGDRPKRIIEP